MKIYRAFAILPLIPLIWSLLLSASAYSDPETSFIADEAGIYDVSNDYIDAEEQSGDKSINVFQKALSLTVEALKDGGKTVLNAFGTILAVLVLASVMGALKNTARSETMSNTYDFVSIIALSAAAYASFYRLFVYVKATLEALSLAMTSLLPVMASLYVMGGNTVAASASLHGMLTFLSVITLISAKVIMPLLQISFALCLAGAIPGSVDLSPSVSLLRSTATTVMAFLFTLLGFSLYLQTSIAAAGDNYVTRSVRFASGVFVPVIGGMLGDASRTVIASVSVIKSTVSASGVVMILGILLPPIITVILYRLGLTCCTSAARMLSCEREGRFLGELGGITGVLLALLIGCTAVCLVSMALLIKIGVAV